MNWKIDYNNADIALQQTKFGLLPLKYRNGGMRMARKILIVDDEPLIVKGLKYSLEQDNYETDSAMDGEEALNKFFAGRYDLVLLDVMLPKVDGIEVCQRIREKSTVPIIMLTAKGEDMDKILGLEYGADDYMTKPFNILEVKSRIKAIFRRTAMMQKESTQSILTVRDMRINLNNRSVTIGQKEINLTAKEFDLLQLFVSNRGKVFSRENLLETIWKYDYLGDLRTVDVHIRRLREKIEKNPAQPEFIFTKWGVGYYFTDKD
jgi:two-component system response regulator VicR